MFLMLCNIRLVMWTVILNGIFSIFPHKYFSTKTFMRHGTMLYWYECIRCCRDLGSLNTSVSVPDLETVHQPLIVKSSAMIRMYDEGSNYITFTLTNNVSVCNKVTRKNLLYMIQSNQHYIHCRYWIYMQMGYSQ